MPRPPAKALHSVRSADELACKYLLISLSELESHHCCHRLCWHHTQTHKKPNARPERLQKEKAKSAADQKKRLHASYRQLQFGSFREFGYGELAKEEDNANKLATGTIAVLLFNLANTSELVAFKQVNLSLVCACVYFVVHRNNDACSRYAVTLRNASRCRCCYCWSSFRCTMYNKMASLKETSSSSAAYSVSLLCVCDSLY